MPAQLCSTLCDPMDCSPPGFSVHEILQARILEWVIVPFSGGSSRPRNQIHVSCVKIKYHYMKITCRNGNLDILLKSRDITFPTKVHLVKAMFFSSSHVWMWELDYKESWALKNWCFWTVVLEKTLESPLDCKEIKPVHPKENQSWIFIGRTDAEAETPILWPPDAKNWLIWRDPDAGKEWRLGKGTTEDEMVGCITNSMDMCLRSSRSWWWTGKPGVLQSMGSQRVGQLSDWTEWH